MTTLGRPANGLPRFYMDVGWYRHPRFLGLPPETLFVFMAMVAYCYDHQLDGEVPCDPDTLGMALGIRPTTVRKAVTAFLEREIVADKGPVLVIRNWEEHNPTAAEMKAASQEKSAAGSWGNHVRHHVNKGVFGDGCVHCQPR